MNPNQNLENSLLVIKDIINKAIKKGVFKNADDVMNVANAYNVIAQEISKQVTNDQK